MLSVPLPSNRKLEPVAGWFSQACFHGRVTTNQLANIIRDKPIQVSLSLSGISALFHEKVHYWQSIGTSYGYYASVMQREQIRLVRFAMLNLKQEFGRDEKFKIMIPFKSWLEREGNRSVRKILQVTLNKWNDIEGKLNVFDGAVQRYQSLKWDNYSHPEGGESPTIELGHDTFCLGATALLEGAVRVAELASIDYLLDEKRNLDKTVNGQEIEREANNIKQELATIKLGLQDYFITKVAMEREVGHFDDSMLLILTDLSLMPPIGDTSFLRKKRHRWEDIHPGWRFKKAIKAVNEMGLQARGNRHEDYQYISKKICDYWDWLTPEKIAEESLRRKHSFLRKQTTFGSPAYKLLDESNSEVSHALAAYTSACELRMKYPGIFTFPHEQMHKLDSTWCMPVFSVDGQWVGRKGSPIEHDMGRIARSLISRQLVLEPRLKCWDTWAELDCPDQKRGCGCFPSKNYEEFCWFVRKFEENFYWPVHRIESLPD